MTVNSRARVRAPVAPLNGEARIGSVQISQLTAGHVVRVLEQNGDWCKVRGADDYEGWMHVGYLESAAGDEPRWQLSLGAMVRLANGQVRSLPCGARFPDSAVVVSGTAVGADKIASRFPHDVSAAAASAVTFFGGASYLWGGVTPWGCDCSGLVQTVFALHGFSLPRDAWQQAEIGTEIMVDALAGTDTLRDFAVGDLLFFSDRGDKRVTHVGIAMADNQFIHCGIRRGGVNVEQLDRDEAYVRQLRSNFVCAKSLVAVGASSP